MARSPAGAAAADWRFVYVAEAHAQDEWPLRSARFSADGQPVVIDQPKTLDARLGRAAACRTAVSSHRGRPGRRAFGASAPLACALTVVRGAARLDRQPAAGVRAGGGAPPRHVGLE